jgi:hypothetical protein
VRHKGNAGPRTWAGLTIVGLAGLLVLIAAIAAWPILGSPLKGLGSAGRSSDQDVERGREPVPEGSVLESPASTSTTNGARQLALATPTQATEAHASEHLGRLIIRDLDGRDLSYEKGEFVLSPREDAPEGAKMLVPFREGRFSLDGFPEGRACIERASVFSVNGDRPVAFDEACFDFKRDESTLLVGHYVPDCTLRVVDARSGVLLDEVCVLPWVPTLAGPEQSHPGPHKESSFLVLDKANPVRLPRTRGLQPYWVTARGYDWAYIMVDHDTGGERDVLLEPAGRLVVEVSGEIQMYMDQGLDIDIRVYPKATRKVAASSELEPRGWQGFPGLVAGAYDVRVEGGPTEGRPIVLGETDVDVIANDTSTARIVLTGDLIPPRVHVRGEIVLPRKYRTLDLSLSLRIQPADGPALRRGDVIHLEYGTMEIREDEAENEVLGWHAEVTSGQYLFIVEPVQHSVLVDVPRSPIDDLRIVLPDLFPVTLRAIDAETRLPIQGAMIRWSRDLPGQAGADRWAERGSEPGVEGVTVHLPAGRFSFVASNPTHGERSMDGYAGGGVEQFTLELPPCISRNIVLIHGNTVIPWVQGTTCNVQNFGSPDFRPCESLGDGKMRACFEQPGLYEIKIDNLDGFRNIAPVVVEVNENDLSPIVIRLDH